MQLMLMKQGGKLIYSGPLGQNSCEVIQYFQVLLNIIHIGRIHIQVNLYLFVEISYWYVDNSFISIWRIKC